MVDLFWLPVAELRKEDGHVVKGIQKGVGSFGLSSAAGVVGVAQTVVGMIQVSIRSLFHNYIQHCWIRCRCLLSRFFMRFIRLLLT